MIKLIRSIAIVAAFALTVAAQPAPTAGAERDWSQWRGPLGAGVSPDGDPPVEWSETKNVRWKIEIPGRGHSTPIVHGDRIFLTAAVPYGEPVKAVPDDAPGAHDNATVDRRHAFVALAVSRRDGKVLWKRTLREGLPHAVYHETGSLASNSPVTDGSHVYVSFGSEGLYCLDRDGELVWERDLGDMRVKHGHGEGTSPVLHGDTLVVNWDHEGQSFVVALDKRTGKDRWRTDRDEATSWATPIVIEPGGRAQVVISGTKRVRSYDLETGDVIWACGGMANNVVASPVAGRGVVVAGSSYEKKAMVAVRLDGAKGDVTGTDHVAWTRRRRTPYVPSPLLYGEWLYFLGHYQGVLTRVKVETGEEPAGPYRLAGMHQIYASPVGAAGRVYITDRNGETLVLRHDRPREMPVLARNRLADRFNASAAIAGRELYLRGERFLYCLAREARTK